LPDGAVVDPPSDVPPVGQRASVAVGPAGGRLALGPVALDVPAGALAADTVLTLVVDDDRSPPGFRAFSPVFRFEPAGLVFARPVEVTLPYGGDRNLATVFWTQPGATTFAAAPTRVDGSLARATVTHFSRGFVGTAAACQDGDCCRRATGKLDVLFVVDDSGSMAEEQATLVSELPRIVRVLATGDRDDDGVQDAPAVADLHVGVVTTNMGVGGFAVPTCGESPLFGDDGVLRTDGSGGGPDCAARYPRVLRYDGTGAPETTAAQLGCLATVGTSGCGFEQQLEAGLKALTPSASPLRFVAGTTGHGDGSNAGFLRDDAALAIVLVTDEEDCSIRTDDPAYADIFNQDSLVYTGDLNLRCFLYREPQTPIRRYVDGLRALKADPSLLVFVPIVGVPTDAVPPGGATAGFDAILADPRMIERVDDRTPSPSTLVPSCDAPGRGVAFPPRRIVETARELERTGAFVALGSVCDERFSRVADTLLAHAGRSLAGVCR
jgi:hypothetical protein